MPTLILALSGILSLIAFVCYVMVVIQMFQRGKTGPGLASTLGLLACGLGYLFAFIYGWIKAAEWNIKNVMLAWSACLVLNIVLSATTLPAAMRQMQQQQQSILEQQQRILEQQQGAPGGGFPPAPAPVPVPDPVPAPALPRSLPDR